MQKFNTTEHPHRRYNPLLDEWILVSPHRAKRPWQGQKESIAVDNRPEYDPSCYLCAGNTRSNGVQNEAYTDCFVFENDFSALLKEEVAFDDNNSDLFNLKPERGINKVVCFSPKHNLTLPEMSIESLEKVVETWKQEYTTLGAIDYINYVQIFENKGSVMGCSNPHPHGQIWAQSSLPTQVQKTQDNLLKYYNSKNTSLLKAYLEQELELKERVVIENEHFAVVVPFWAIWPYETLVISKRHVENITQFTSE
ncbi:MAG TPA: galactose-1-phosphate uridylyltransferase, partial [Flavobacterium sp.]|nr:galactose-1-phosphate uridylyltransferase [Flavobacterium sp.]